MKEQTILLELPIEEMDLYSLERLVEILHTIETLEAKEFLDDHLNQGNATNEFYMIEYDTTCHLTIDENRAITITDIIVAPIAA